MHVLYSFVYNFVVYVTHFATVADRIPAHTYFRAFSADEIRKKSFPPQYTSLELIPI